MKGKTLPQPVACPVLRRCTQCRYPFAPGAIEHQPRRRRWSRATRIAVVRAALVLVVLASMAAMGSLLTGGLL
jgi:hypothetical protein